jgi:hypothetical protein
MSRAPLSRREGGRSPAKISTPARALKASTRTSPMSRTHPPDREALFRSAHAREAQPPLDPQGSAQVLKACLERQAHAAKGTFGTLTVAGVSLGASAMSQARLLRRGDGRLTAEIPTSTQALKAPNAVKASIRASLMFRTHPPDREALFRSARARDAQPPLDPQGSAQVLKACRERRAHAAKGAFAAPTVPGVPLRASAMSQARPSRRGDGRLPGEISAPAQALKAPDALKASIRASPMSRTHLPNRETHFQSAHARDA